MGNCFAGTHGLDCMSDFRLIRGVEDTARRGPVHPTNVGILKEALQLVLWTRPLAEL